MDRSRIGSWMPSTDKAVCATRNVPPGTNDAPRTSYAAHSSASCPLGGKAQSLSIETDIVILMP